MSRLHRSQPSPLVYDSGIAPQQTHLDAGRGVAVSREKGEDVVLAAVAGLDDEAQVRRQRTAVGGTRGLLVGVGRGEVVGELREEEKGR